MAGKAHILSFLEVIEMGEYKPEFLEKYPEWKTFSKHTQLQYIRQALDNRRKQLLSQWVEVNNAIDFRLKPGMQQTLNNIHKQLDELERDREELYVKFSG